ncbi:hypothetical protein V1522DRAFT_395815 [Lipomyces starkeyi]
MQAPIYSFASKAASRANDSSESSMSYTQSSQELINLDDEIGYSANKRVMNDEGGLSRTQFGKRVQRIESDDSEGDEAGDNTRQEGFELGGDDDGPLEHELNSECAARGPLPKRAKATKTRRI